MFCSSSSLGFCTAQHFSLSLLLKHCKMSQSDSLPAASSIPKITDLRDQLGYGDSQLPRCRAFYDDITAFRRKYRTSLGLSGVDLIDWKSPSHQCALDKMVHVYLDIENNGALYWPDHQSPNCGHLSYNDDRSL